MGDFSILLYLGIYSIIYLYHCGFMDIYLIIWIIMEYYFINFVAETISVVATGSVFNWLQGLFDMLSFLCVCVCVCL